MTIYDFDRVVDRTGTSCYKWDQRKKLFGSDDILPLWVADMDFEAPKEVVEALTRRAALGVYGYTYRPDSFYEAIEGWLSRRHGWNIKREWISSSPGVVPALGLAVQAYTQPGDGIIVQSPVYRPFFDVIETNGRKVVNNPLVLRDGRYSIDLELLERQARDGAKMLLLCSPHNPGGRVWTRAELEEIGRICLAHGVIVVADEIHHDLILRGHKHTPFAAISDELAQISMTCIAPSKTFNLAGLHTAVVIIANEEMRNRYDNLLKKLYIQSEGYFGVTAVESGYRYGEEWLEQLLDYIEGNLNVLLDYCARRLPEAKPMKPEGTYLVWLDCREISENPEQLKKLMFEQAGVAFSEGSVFGEQGAGYLRLNLACPRSILEEALERFGNAAREWLDGRVKNETEEEQA